MTLLLGTSGFQYPEWKGTFYPEKMPPAKMLSFYAERFPTTEINYSFRHIPSAATLARWDAATPAPFRFSFKAPQKVTHFAKLRGCADTLRFFAGQLSELGEKLGPVLFQLPPSFKKDAGLLREFLHEVPSGLRAAFEFRHASWFDDEVFAALREGGAALCLAEDDDLATPRIATASFGYARLRRPDYGEADLRAWADFLHTQEASWSDAFVYLKHEEAGTGPRFARQLGEIFGA